MTIHILNGDGLAENFNLEGEIVVCREALIEGNLEAENLNDFWQGRADFIKSSYDQNSYFENVKTEFDKLNKLKPIDEINLWFGNEAFCQVNMWFCVWLVAEKGAKIYRIFPDSKGWNCGFNELEKCFENRQRQRCGTDFFSATVLFRRHFRKVILWQTYSDERPDDYRDPACQQRKDRNK